MQRDSLTDSFFAQLAEPFTAEALFDQVPDVVYFLKDSEGRYICVNQTLVQRSGKTAKSELIGRTPAQVLGEQLGQSYEEQDRRVLQSGRKLLDELEVHVYPNRDLGWALTSKLPVHRGIDRQEDR